jgi:cell fate regulator YaaT (PSP1 superfamily)
MANIVGVRFWEGDKIFYCDAGNIPLKAGDHVVVDTEYGLDLAMVIIPEGKVQTSELAEPLTTVVRQAQPKDLGKAQQHRGEEALAKCKEMVAKLGLKVKPLAAHYNLDGTHLTILFSAPDRVDFRGLVRKLSRRLKTRIELRQIGPRDKAKLVGLIGKCGYPLCCRGFLTDFTPVSIKMAKEQNLPLNPMKISGICGRLLCCLGYENEEYAEMKRKMPQLGQEILAPFGKAKVIGINLLKETVTVEHDSQIRELPLDQLTWK